MLSKRFLGIIFGENKKEEEEYEGLPKGCRRCELLGICRRPKEQGWKCRHGCMILNEKERRGSL